MPTIQIQYKIALRFVLLMLALGCLQACAMGFIKVEGPQLPPIKNTISIDRSGPIDAYFEVCVPPELRSTGWKNVMNKKIEEVLQRDFDIHAHSRDFIHAHQEVLAIDKPHFQFLITPTTDSLYGASAVITFFTFSAIPGYVVDKTQIDIQFAAQDANGEIIQKSYKYEYRQRYFFWLPLIFYPIFYPDTFASINGAYLNTSKENLGLELVLNRFIHDASERMRQHPKDSKIADVLQELKCP